MSGLVVRQPGSHVAVTLRRMRHLMRLKAAQQGEYHALNKFTVSPCAFPTAACLVNQR